MIRFLLFLVFIAPSTVVAQSQATTPDSLRSSIAGTVRDSLGLPVVGASVLITPGGLIFRTDTAGKFNARNIAPGALTIGIRKLGFSPLQSQVSLHVGADLAIDLVMQRLPQMLAEVEVRTERQCSRFSIEGILCRRESGMGYFMNRQEVLEKSKGIYHRNLVLRDVPGFRQNLNGNPTTVESIVGWRCIRWIYDGGFPYSYNPIPHATDIYAVEVYQPPDIPKEYEHQYWGTSGKMSAPCTLVVMWSMREAQRGLRRMTTPTYCRGADSMSAHLIAHLRQIATDTEEPWPMIRDSLKVPAVPASQISLVMQEATCKKAAERLDAEIVRTEKTPSVQRKVYLIKVGNMYAAMDPDSKSPASEWRTMVLMTNRFEVLSSWGQ